MFTFDYPLSEYPASDLPVFHLDHILDSPSSARQSFFSRGGLVVRPKQDSLSPDQISTVLANVGGLFGRTLVRDAYRRSTSPRANGLTVDPDYVHRPHAEASFSPVRPSVLAFACTHQSDESDVGGLTTLLDGFNIWSQCSASTKQILLNAKLKYELRIQVKPRPTSSDVLRPWFLSDIGVTNAHLDMKNGHLFFNYTHNFLHYHPLTRDIVIANHAFINIDTEEQILSRSCDFDDSVSPSDIDNVTADILSLLSNNVTTLSWKTGDILLLDNMRYMHGRLPAPEGLKRSLKVLQYRSYLL